MWMDWPDWNASVARLVMKVKEHVPDALVRFDFLGEGWGCSVMPFATTNETYGEGMSPRSAIEDALWKLEGCPDA